MTLFFLYVFVLFISSSNCYLMNASPKILLKLMNEIVLKDNQLLLETSGKEIIDTNKLNLLIESLNSNDLNKIQKVLGIEIPTLTDDLMILHYFFKYISIDIFKFDEHFVDPFIKNKYEYLMKSMKNIEDILARINDIDDIDDNAEMLNVLLQISLLSTNILKPTPEIIEGTIQTKKKKDLFFNELKLRKSTIKIDDSNKVFSILDNKDTEKDTVIFITGETGADIVSDLLFAHILLEKNICKNVILCTKTHPHQIKGLTKADLFGIIDVLSDPKSSDVWAIRAFGTSIRQKIRVTGQITIMDDIHFTLAHRPLFDIEVIDNNEMLKNNLPKTKLIISKNYENYNRIKLMNNDISFLKAPIVAITIDSDNNGIIKLFT